MKTTNGINQKLSKMYLTSDFESKPELRKLLNYLQDNKNQKIENINKEVTHLYKKYLFLYTPSEMVDILINRKMDMICAKLVSFLRKQKAAGRVDPLTKNLEMNNLIYKYL